MKTRVRKLSNGKYVGEVKRNAFCFWKAVDNHSPRLAWSAGDSYYSGCFCDSKEDAEQIIIQHLSSRYGV